MNADRDRQYNIHILNTGIDDDKKQVVLDMADDVFHIYFNDVTEYLKELEKRLPLRDYYSYTTYYRLFLAEMFPEYEKALYIDSDTVVLGDISELFDYDIGDNYVGASCDPVVSQADIFGNYAEQVLDIDRNHYFNAGVLPGPVFLLSIWKNRRLHLRGSGFHGSYWPEKRILICRIVLLLYGLRLKPFPYFLIQ